MEQIFQTLNQWGKKITNKKALKTFSFWFSFSDIGACECWISICLLRKEKIHLKVCKTRYVADRIFGSASSNVVYSYGSRACILGIHRIWLLLSIDVRPFELGHKNVRRTKTTSIHWIQLTSDNVKRVYINRRGAMARHIPLLFLSRFFFISFDSCFFTKIRCCFSTHIKCVLFSIHWKHFYVFDYWSKYA